MTGLYSQEAQDDSSADLAQDTSESDSLPNNEKDDAVPHNVTVSTTLANPSIVTTTCMTISNASDTVIIKCHSRQPSNSAGLMDKCDDVDEEFSKDCGIFSCRPAKMQKLARIKVHL